MTNRISSEAHGRRPGESLVELSRDECLALLGSNSFGRLAVSGGGESPIIRPVNYIFDHRSQSVVFRTAAGSKLHFLVRAAKAAFEIDGIDPETRTGWSVIVAGVAEQITNPTELQRVAELGLDTWPGGERHHWTRIRTGTVSGRRVCVTREPHV